MMIARRQQRGIPRLGLICPMDAFAPALCVGMTNRAASASIFWNCLRDDSWISGEEDGCQADADRRARYPRVDDGGFGSIAYP